MYNIERWKHCLLYW